MNLRDYKLLIPTAQKSITADQFHDDRYWIETGAGGDRRRVRNKESETIRTANYRDAIGVIYRCVDVRSAILSSLPWTILRGNEVFIDSETAYDEAGWEWLDNINSLLYLTESSLLLSSEAFWLKEKSLLGKQLGMRWLASPFVYPKYDETKGIVGFERKWGTVQEDYSLEEVVYFWVQNPLSELTPDLPQVLAAATSANVIINYEDFVSKFYERGAVKATILKVDRSTPPKERTRLREFWQNFMSGNKNAYATEVVSGDVEAEVIGEGAGDSERTEVLVSRRKDIATSMGVPYSLLFGDTSSSYTAGPTEEKNFLNYTVIPRAKLVQRFLNMQMFKEQGLYFRFNTSTLPAFKEANEIVAKVFTTYTSSLIPHSVSAKLAGIVLPEGTTYEDLDAMVAAERERQFKEKERIVTLNSKLTPEGEKPKEGEGTKPRSNEKPKGEDNNIKDIEVRRLRKWLRNRKNASIEDFESEVLDTQEKLEIYNDERGATSDLPPFGSSKALTVFGGEDGLDADIEGLSESEGQGAKAIETAFAMQISNVMKRIDGMDKREVSFGIEQLFTEYSDDLQDYILALLLSYADVGVTYGSNRVKEFYPGFDSTDASFKAREWAAKRAVEVFAIVQATTIRKAKATVAEWQLSTLPVEWLEAELRKFMNLERARVIAENESIAVINQAALFVYESAKVVQFVRWTATLDERTCPMCGRLHGKTYPLGSAPKAPIHVRCRCYLRPVIDPKFVQWFFDMRTP